MLTAMKANITQIAKITGPDRKTESFFIPSVVHNFSYLQVNSSVVHKSSFLLSIGISCCLKMSFVVLFAEQSSSALQVGRFGLLSLPIYIRLSFNDMRR